MPYVFIPGNKNATIRTRCTRNGKLRTETHRRDSGSMKVAISTDSNGSGGTHLYVDLPEASLKFDGREARTLYRVLTRHFEAKDSVNNGK